MAPSTDTNMAVDYYELLSIPVTASEPEIRRAYRKTSLLYHPDKVKSTPETVEKFQLLQVALNILTDPSEKVKYDQSREARLRRKAENEALESRRRKMKEELERREGGMSTGASTVSGVKRAWSERELEINRIKEDNKRRKEAMMQERQKRAEEELVAQKPEEPENPAEASQRSVKVRWVKEGDGIDIDADWIKQASEMQGQVEDVIILKDRKRKVDGREKKVACGTALVIFTTLQAATQAVSTGIHGALESVSWATTKEDEPS